MRLHVIPGSPNARKVEALLLHLDLPVERIVHDPRSGALRTPEFLALNPMGMVPVLEDGEVTLFESNAILQYLADKAGRDDLFPRAGQARYQTVAWLFWETAHFNRAVGMICWERAMKAKFGFGAADEAIIADGLRRWARVAPVFEARLAGRPWAMGEGPSIVDFALGAFAPFVAEAALPLADHPDIAAWYRRLDTLPAWRASAPVLPGERP